MSIMLNISNKQSIKRKIIKTLNQEYRQLYHTLILTKQPKIFCNSFPKSGTHLLVGLVSGLPGLFAYGRKVYRFSMNNCFVDPLQKPPTFEPILQMCLPGEIYRGHVAADVKVSKFLQIHKFKHLFIYRDLRDVVISLLFWWKKQKEYKLWPFRYFDSLETDDERIRFLIEGWPENPPKGFPYSIPFPDIGTRFLDFFPWLFEKNTLTLRFEDLVNEKSRSTSFTRMIQYIMPNVDEELIPKYINLMELGANPKSSKTYRVGKTGQWPQYFSLEHKNLFKSKAGKLLIELGYEKDEDW